MYIHEYIYIHIYAHRYIHVYMHIYVHMYIFIHKSLFFCWGPNVAKLELAEYPHQPQTKVAFVGLVIQRNQSF